MCTAADQCALACLRVAAAGGWHMRPTYPRFCIPAAGLAIHTDSGRAPRSRVQVSTAPRSHSYPQRLSLPLANHTTRVQAPTHTPKHSAHSEHTALRGRPSAAHTVQHGFLRLFYAARAAGCRPGARIARRPSSGRHPGARGGLVEAVGYHVHARARAEPGRRRLRRGAPGGQSPAAPSPRRVRRAAASSSRARPSRERPPGSGTG